MINHHELLDKLNSIERKINEQSLLQKAVLTLNEASRYLDLSPSHLYKLTSQKKIPHYQPQGKRLYFKRVELDEWLLRNRQSSEDEEETEAANHLIRHKRRQ